MKNLLREITQKRNWNIAKVAVYILTHADDNGVFSGHGYDIAARCKVKATDVIKAVSMLRNSSSTKLVIISNVRGYVISGIHWGKPAKEKTARKKILVSSDQPPLIDTPKHDIQNLISKHCIQLSKMREISFEECSKISDLYFSDEIREIIMAMENKKGFSEKYASIYLTFIQWAKTQWGPRTIKPVRSMAGHRKKQ